MDPATLKEAREFSKAGRPLPLKRVVRQRARAQLALSFPIATEELALK
jgi:hypothetical protein